MPSVAEGMEAMAERTHGVLHKMPLKRGALLVAADPEVSEQWIQERRV
jgi:hypothetical protein